MNHGLLLFYSHWSIQSPGHFSFAVLAW